jgi:hypothetical protein
VALAAAGTLLLAGCGGQVGAAAVVAGDPISTATIDAQRSALPDATDTAAPAADRVAQAARVTEDRTLVTYAIWHRQLQRAGIVSPLTEEEYAQVVGDADTVSRISGLLVTGPDTLRERVEDTLSLQQLVQDAVQAGTPVSGPTIRYEFLSTGTLSDALEARTRYAGDPDAWAGDVAAAGEQQGGEGSAVAAGAGARLIPTGLFSADPGSFVVVPGGDGTATVLRVIERSVAAAPLDEAALSELDLNAVNALGGMLLAQRAGAAAADVEVNPRFGVWDPVVAHVVPAPAQL